MSKTPTVICLDVEDFIAPESDDVALWLAEGFTEHGLTATFMLVGEKARVLERRGRRDVLEALKNHHIGYHSTWHSVHPTTTEHCLDKDFATGMDALWEWDKEGWADTERIIGRPLPGWGCTGYSWSPQVMGLMGRMGRAYGYSLVRVPGHNVCWYANSLAFYAAEGFLGLDDCMYDKALFEAKFAEAKSTVDRYVALGRTGAHWLCFFEGHPSRIIHDTFWDEGNFAKGANPPRSAWKPAALRDPSLIPMMQEHHRQVCEYLRSDNRLEIVGWGDLIRRYDAQRPSASHDELIEIARRIADERQVLFTDYFSAAEILLMLCRAAVSPPATYTRPTVFGPLTMPPVSPSADLSGADAIASASSVLLASESGYLPPSVQVASHTIGIGTYFVALAQAILGQERVSGPIDAFYPTVANAIGDEVARTLPKWPIHPDPMDTTKLIEQTRLQCWTLKPAMTRS